MIQEINEDLEKTHISPPSSMDEAKWRDLVNHVQRAQLPTLKLGEDRPYNSQDFDKSLENRLQSIKTIEIELKGTDFSLDLDDKITLKHFVAPLIVICGENAKSTEWSTAKTIEISYKILTLLKTKFFKTDSMIKIFVNRPDVLKLCLNEVQQKLGKDSWKNHPGAQCSFAWILRQISSPHVSQYLQEFLPFSLRFLDDWEIKNKLFAIQCLDHIIENVNPSELSKFGYTDVIKSALFHVLNFRELDLTSANFVCLFKFLEKCFGRNKCAEDFAKFNVWDELTKKMLYSMQIETQKDMKQLQMKHLTTLLRNLDLGTVRWLTTILNLFSQYVTEPYDEVLVNDTLENLLVIEELCKERVKFHTDVIYELLVRLLYDLSKEDTSSTKHKTFQLASKALELAAKESPEEFRRDFDSFDSLEGCEPLKKVVSDILITLNELNL